VIHPDQEVGEVVPNVVVTKEEAETVRNVVVNIQPPLVHAVKVGAATDKAIMKTVIQDIDAESSGTPDADTEEEEEAASVVSEVEDDVVSEAASEAEDDMVEDTDEADIADTAEEAVETEEAVEAAEEEEEEEDDDLEILKIKKGRYYFSPSSKRIYEYLEGGYGDCLGTFVDGKIIPKE